MEMLGEIIQELTEVKVDSIIMSGNVLAWAKRVEAQRTQATVMSSITEAKEFNKIKISKNACKDSSRRSMQTRLPMKQTCRYCRSSHPLRQCLAYWQTVWNARKLVTSEGCAEVGGQGPWMRWEQETVQHDTRYNIQWVSINSIQFNKNQSVLTANFNT